MLKPEDIYYDENEKLHYKMMLNQESLNYFFAKKKYIEVFCPF